MIFRGFWPERPPLPLPIDDFTNQPKTNLGAFLSSNAFFNVQNPVTVNYLSLLTCGCVAGKVPIVSVIYNYQPAPHPLLSFSYTRFYKRRKAQNSRHVKCTPRSPFGYRRGVTNNYRAATLETCLQTSTSDQAAGSFPPNTKHPSAILPKTTLNTI